MLRDLNVETFRARAGINGEEVRLPVYRFRFFVLLSVCPVKLTFPGHQSGEANTKIVQHQTLL